jgi:Zn-dependent protease with chaperone function
MVPLTPQSGVRWHPSCSDANPRLGQCPRISSFDSSDRKPVTVELTRQFKEISPKVYEHPADRAATSALHAVPLLDTVVKRLTDLGHERRTRQIVIGNAVRLGEQQVPDIWAQYVECISILDLDRTPDLYVINDPEVNAMAIGAKTPIVVVNSSLIASYTAAETQAVLGHEIGHVLSEHTYYTTALVLLHQFMKGALPKSLLLGLPVRGMYYALLEWARAAEMSSDRAAALVMGDPLVPCHVLMRLAGGALPGMNFDAFMQQADAYEDEDDLFSRQARFWSELSLTHPVAVRRVKELNAWVRSGDYDRIMSGDYAKRGHEPAPSAEFDAAVGHYKERFSGVLDRTAGGVQGLGRQLGDWLKRLQGEPNESAEENGDTP